MTQFSYQYTPAAKAYLESSRTSAMELFREILFCKIQKTPVPEPLFNKVIAFYPATSLKERTPIQVFSDEFCEMLKTFFYRASPGDYFCSTKKYLTNKIVKNSLRKEKNENSL